MKMSPSNPRLIKRNAANFEKLDVLRRQINILLTGLVSDVANLKREGKCTEKYLALQEAQLNAAKAIFSELLAFADSEKTQKSIDSILKKAEEFWKPYSKFFPK